MRVIAGEAKNRKLETLSGLSTRPTGDRVKEAWFNIINTSIYKSDVLDLFSGSGALGIEALSRGAQKCVFVEQSAEAVAVIKKNLENTKLSLNAIVVQADVLAFLEKCRDTFDFIFLDPPYHKGLVTDTIEKISNKKNLRPDGMIIAETDYDEIMPDTIGDFFLTETRKYGRALLNFYKY